MHSNEFTGATLAEAVKKATAVYDQRKQHGANPDQERQRQEEDRKQRRCNDLILRMSILSNQATRYADEADRLIEEAKRLRQDALRKGLTAAAGIIGGGALSALLRYRRVARALGKMRKGNFSAKTIAEFLLAVSYIGAAIEAFNGIQDLREAQQLARKAENLKARSESTGQEYMQTFTEYDRLGCGESPRFIGTGT